MWKRISRAYLNVIVVIAIILVVFISLALMSENVAIGIIVLGVGVLLIFILASTMGMLIEMAFHLEAIENNTKHLNFSNLPSSNSFLGNVNEPTLFSKKSSVWCCAKCGSNNPSYLTTCKCGLGKYESIDMNNKVNVKDNSDFHKSDQLLDRESWKCKKCGSINGNKIFICKCGMKKSVNNEETVDTPDNVIMALKEAEEKNKADFDSVILEETTSDSLQPEEKTSTMDNIQAGASTLGVNNQGNLDQNGNPYFFDQNGKAYYIAPDGNAYYYQE